MKCGREGVGKCLDSLSPHPTAKFVKVCPARENSPLPQRALRGLSVNSPGLCRREFPHSRRILARLERSAEACFGLFFSPFPTPEASAIERLPALCVSVFRLIHFRRRAKRGAGDALYLRSPSRAESPARGGLRSVEAGAEALMVWSRAIRPRESCQNREVAALSG